jgi:hypothetical protein
VRFPLRFIYVGDHHGDVCTMSHLIGRALADLRSGPVVLTVPEIDDAWDAFDAFKKSKIDTGEVTSADLFGTRTKIDGNWMYRMAAVVLGTYGNSAVEAFYPLLQRDSDGNALSGANNYTLTFPKDQLPPVNAFWSVTMYDLPQSLLVENPINRYLINSPMLPDLKTNSDGSLTIYIQHDSPGKEKGPNWLPAPEGPFWMAMRLYWPKKEALSGTWKAQRLNLSEKPRQP